MKRNTNIDMNYYVANWKAHMGLSDTKTWTDTFRKLVDSDRALLTKLESHALGIIICPPFPLLYPLRNMLRDIPAIAFGSQDISRMDAGSYTGECSASMLKDFVSYAIIGHSERKHYFGESGESVQKKILLAKKYDIQPIACISGKNDYIPQEVTFIAYEPDTAIGSGLNEDPQKVVEIKHGIAVRKNTNFLYGGSVDSKNVTAYLDTHEINGFLIGKASLDAEAFYSIVSRDS